MKDRIKQIMESQHMTQQTFANFLGMSAASLSSIFNERTKPTLNTVEAIRSKLPSINLEWLMFGKGPMYVDGKDNQAEGIVDDQPNQTSEPMLDFTPTPEVTVSHQQPASPTGFRNVSNQSKINLNYFDKTKRQITEIRVFYDDQTWESFVPKK